MKTKTWFAWFPVRVHRMGKFHIDDAGWAFWERVRIVDNVWHGPIFFVLAAICLLAGCDRMAVMVKGEPYDAQCSNQCALPCDEPLDLADGDPNTLLAVSKVNRAYLVRCTARHDACSECIDRLRQAKVIR